MADSQITRGATSTKLVPPDPQEIFDFLERGSDATAPFDASYGDTLPGLLPTRLSDLVKARWRAC